jgi:hypothetical protein
MAFLTADEHNSLIKQWLSLKDDFFVRMDKHHEYGSQWTAQQYKAYRIGVDGLTAKMEAITKKICGPFYVAPVKRTDADQCPF